jgi:hypothetical protein
MRVTMAIRLSTAAAASEYSHWLRSSAQFPGASVQLSVARYARREQHRADVRPSLGHGPVRGDGAGTWGPGNRIGRRRGPRVAPPASDGAAMASVRAARG